MPSHHYWIEIKNDIERYNNEKMKISEHLNHKYRTDPDFKEKRKKQALDYYYRKKQEAEQLKDINYHQNILPNLL